MNDIVLTPEFLADKTSWPIWLQKAWEADWGTPGSFCPVPDKIGEYELFSKLTGKPRSFKVGDTISKVHMI